MSGAKTAIRPSPTHTTRRPVGESSRAYLLAPAKDAPAITPHTPAAHIFLS